MANMNLLVLLNTYSDKKASNNPSLANFKWARDISGISAEDPSSQTHTIAAAGTVSALSGGTKKLVYIESDQEVELTINGGDPITLKPVIVNTSKYPGILLLTADISTLSIENVSADEAQVFVASIE
jgi:hypothetical protein